MPREPQISQFLDDEERELVASIEDHNHLPGQTALTVSRLAFLQSAARATISEGRTKISLRLPNSDLARLKAKALQEGMPYQTLINSILHKAVSG